MTDQIRVVPTVGEIARRLGTPVHRVEYAIRAYQIQPVGWAGNARVFSEDAVRRIAEILSESGPTDPGHREDSFRG